MKLPFVILSYDNFNNSGKLFSYQSNKEIFIPVFDDAVLITDFVKTISQVDNRQLSVNVLVERSQACEIFSVVLGVCPAQIIFNPRFDDGDFVGEKITIEDFLK